MCQPGPHGGPVDPLSDPGQPVVFFENVGVGTFTSRDFPRLRPHLIVDAVPTVPNSVATVQVLDASRFGTLEPPAVRSAISTYTKFAARGLLERVGVQITVTAGQWSVWGAWTDAVPDLVAAPFAGPLTNCSGTITSGGTSQQVAAANPTRRYLLFENVSNADLWVRFGAAAVQNQPSYRLFSGGSLVMESGFVSTQSVNVIGATTGQAFTCNEG
jgi:hypothetical protein